VCFFSPYSCVHLRPNKSVGHPITAGEVGHAEENWAMRAWEEKGEMGGGGSWAQADDWVFLFIFFSISIPLFNFKLKSSFEFLVQI
jgi:hypothetical protein